MKISVEAVQILDKVRTVEFMSFFYFIFLFKIFLLEV